MSEYWLSKKLQNKVVEDAMKLIKLRTTDQEKLDRIEKDMRIHLEKFNKKRLTNEYFV